MIKRATAIIGAGFGDEGKGKMTDYAASPMGTVVRFNGGAQAGHTVTRGGRRHVFSHFGAGTFAGAATFLSRFFLVNPIMWEQEREHLAAYAPQLTIDPAAPLSTPFDMTLNQAVERARGGARHGSCGMGINETVRRCETEFATTAADMRDPARLLDKLAAIRTVHVPARLAALGIDATPELAAILDGETDRRFVDLCRHMIQSTAMADAEFLRAAGPLVFEGAQGLLLDQHESSFFPHVTPSSTGLTNVAVLAREIGIEQIDAVYCTRSYLTRHGAGPHPTEDSALRFVDETNAPNEFQGRIRFGYLDLDLLRATIAADLTKAADLQVESVVAISCLDQTPTPKAWRGGALHTYPDQNDFIADLAHAASARRVLASWGPRPEDVVPMLAVPAMQGVAA